MIYTHNGDGTSQNWNWVLRPAIRAALQLAEFEVATTSVTFFKHRRSLLLTRLYSFSRQRLFSWTALPFWSWYCRSGEISMKWELY